MPELFMIISKHVGLTNLRFARVHVEFSFVNNKFSRIVTSTTVFNLR